MKFGMRKPSIKKSIKARTTGKVKRAMKKAINPLYGKKGMGIIKNPKKAIYNKVYNKTTFGINDIVKTTNTIASRSNKKSSINCGGKIDMIGNEKNSTNGNQKSIKSAVVNLIIVYFLGIFGVHKFINKDKKMGLIYLFTLGIFGFGWIYDIVIAIIEVFKEIKNRKQKNSIQNSDINEEIFESEENDKTEKISVKNIIVWIVSIFSILAGICSNEFTISNILFIFAGLCIMPPIVNKITTKTKKYSKKMKWIIFILLTIFAYGTYPVDNSIETNNNYTDSSIVTEEKKETEEQAKKEAEEQAKKEAEEQAKKEAEEQAKKEAEEQAKKEAEEQAKKEAEEQAKKEAEEQAKKEAEEQARKQAEEQARKQAVAQQAQSQQQSNSRGVYRTPSGKRYHFDPNCGGKNSYSTTLDSAISSGLTPCQKCAQ